MLKLNHSQEGIVSALGGRAAITRRDLCRKTGLSWAAISKTVSQLQTKGLLIYGDTISNKKRGRDPEEICFGPKYLMLGVSVERGHISFCLVNLKFELIYKLDVLLEDGDDPVPSINKQLKIFISEYKNRIITIGISFPGIIDPCKDVVMSSVNFPECAGRNIKNEIKTAISADIPVIIERNAVCNLTYLNLVRHLTEDSILISANHGVSAALLVDGQILHGRSGNIGELGHIRVSGALDGSIPCDCGRTGCIETLTGGKAWQRKWDEINRKSKFPAELSTAFEAAIPEAIELIGSGMEVFFPAIAFVITLFKPEKLIFTLNLPESSSLVIATYLTRIFEREKIANPPALDFIFRKDEASSIGAALLGFNYISGNPFYKFTE